MIDDDQTIHTIDIFDYIPLQGKDRKNLLEVKVTLKQEATVISHNGT